MFVAISLSKNNYPFLFLALPHFLFIVYIAQFVMLSLLLLPLLASASALPTVTSSDASKPYQLRGVQSPIFHLYLQS